MILRFRGSTRVAVCDVLFMHTAADFCKGDNIAMDWSGYA